jgi:hypothetical protein
MFALMNMTDADVGPNISIACLRGGLRERQRATASESGTGGGSHNTRPFTQRSSAGTAMRPERGGLRDLLDRR